MVIRLVSVSDRTDLPGLHDVFHAILGWSGAISAISFAFTAKSSTASAAAHEGDRCVTLFLPDQPCETPLVITDPPGF